jgi:hypothetical protein
MGNRISKINFGNEIELESNSGSSMRVNSSKLFGGDFKIVQLIDKLLNRHACNFVDESRSDFFLLKDFLQHDQIPLDGLCSLQKFGLTSLL